MSPLTAILRVIAVVSVGLIAGIFIGHRTGLHYAVPQISASSFVQLGQIINVHYIRFMPSLVLTSLVSSVLWLVMVRSHWRTTEFWLVGISACAILALLVLTRVVNVPLNNQLMTWNADSPPSNAQQIWEPWERANTLRSIFATMALVLETVALTLRTGVSRCGLRATERIA